MRTSSLSPIVVVLVLAAQPARAAGMGVDRFVTLEKEAVLMMPARLVATGEIRWAKWSPDGKHILVCRREYPFPLRLTPQSPPPRVRYGLALWSAATGESRAVWSYQGDDEPWMEFDWLPRGLSAVGQIEVQRLAPPEAPGRKPEMRRERWAFRLDGRRGTLKSLFRTAPFSELSFSPSLPVAAATSDDRQVRLIREDGSVSTVPLPSGAVSGVTNEWTNGGTQVVVGFMPAAVGGTERAPWLLVDVVTGKTTVAPRLALDPPRLDQPPTPLNLREVPLPVINPPLNTRVSSLWLEAPGVEQPKALVATQVEWGQLSPRHDAILYVDANAAWVVQLSTLPKEAFFQARLAARRATVISNGKQLAVALMMYAQDYCERFPGSDQSMRDLLMPYVKNESLFEGFVYTYPGGSLADIDMPAELVLGHVLGPGGRALIYADGHVKWLPDK
jgi:hypothetical protein